MKSISIVIPVYNSEQTIETLVNALKEILTGKAEFEIVLVNDNSWDNSYFSCKKLAEQDTHVKFIDLATNFGQHNAILSGLRVVEKDLVVCMDDDLQNPPEEIFKLVEKLEEGYDVVFSKYETLKEKSFRRFGSWINNVMSEFLISKPKNLYLSSYFIMRRFIADEIARYDGPYAYIAGLILRVTGNIGSVTVSHHARQTGKSNYSFIKLLSLWMNGFTNFSLRPLRIATLGGVTVGLLGFLFLLVVVIQKVLNPSITIGWTSTIAIILFMGGLQLISIGMVGEYVGRIFLTINKKPQSVIKEQINIGRDNIIP